MLVCAGERSFKGMEERELRMDQGEGGEGRADEKSTMTALRDRMVEGVLLRTWKVLKT